MKPKQKQRDEQATLTTTCAEDGFRRTAIQLKGLGITSVDLVDGDGYTIARLNLANFGDGRANVDVVFAPNAERVKENGVIQRAHPTHDHEAAVLTFPGCVRKIATVGENCGLVAVAFNYPRKGE